MCSRRRPTDLLEERQQNRRARLHHTETKTATGDQHVHELQFLFIHHSIAFFCSCCPDSCRNAVRRIVIDLRVRDAGLYLLVAERHAAGLVHLAQLTALVHHNRHLTNKQI